ncbi:MAG: hypothetical protein D6790_11310 [Caldilineae bacterium]|nr:MAG: hypothetical protein D6790_11310 [Caldilineae bacterium]
MIGFTAQARQWIAVMLCLALLMSLSGCTALPPPPKVVTVAPGHDVGDRINVAREASLADTIAIEIGTLKLDGAMTYPTAARVEDPEQIQAIVAALDTELPLSLPVVCVDQYRLRFYLKDGQVVEFGYYCDPESTFLHGGIPALQGYAVEPPESFDALIQAAAKVRVPD